MKGRLYSWHINLWSTLIILFLLVHHFLHACNTKSNQGHLWCIWLYWYIVDQDRVPRNRCWSRFRSIKTLFTVSISLHNPCTWSWVRARAHKQDATRNANHWFHSVNSMCYVGDFMKLFFSQNKGIHLCFITLHITLRNNERQDV